MLDNEGAGEGDDTLQGGSGAPSGGSLEGGSENDDKPITARQLKAALASQRQAFAEQMAAKDRELQAFKEGVGKREPADTPKVYTRPELKAAVDNGQITQEQADELWDKQRDAQTTAKAREAALEVVVGTTQKGRVDGDLARYKQLAPEILDASSDVRQKIVVEFKELVANGLPNSLPTELAAIRAVMGPLDKLEKARSARRSEDPDQQGGGNSEPPKGKGKTFADQLNARARDYYQKQIDAKRYPDWKAVEAEVKFANPKRRQEMGLRS